MTTPPTKSCASCKFFVPRNDMRLYAGRVLGADACARYGKMLTNSTHTDATVVKSLALIASTCSEFQDGPPGVRGQPLSVPNLIDIGMPTARVLQHPREDASEVKSCTECLFLATAPRVASDLGFTVEACIAQGKLLVGRDRRAIARDCDVKSLNKGPRTFSATDIKVFSHLLPEDMMFPQSIQDRMNEALKSDRVDPVDYESDCDVSDEDREAGIRAWRLWPSPYGSDDEIAMPIFDLEKMSPEDRDRVPRTGDDEHPELYEDYTGAVWKVLVLWLQMDETPALWGAAGVGKTELLRHIAWLMCLPFERISITATTELDDLQGSMRLVSDDGGPAVTKFHMGRVPKAWGRPCVLCIDEPNVGPPEVWQFLRPLTDNSKQLVIDAGDGQIVKRNPHCYPGLAMNPSWDPRNEGANTLADADSSRLMHVWMELPPEDIEKHIISARVALDGWLPSKETLNHIMVTAKDIRQMCDDQQIPGSWGIRHQVQVVRALRWFKPAEAYRLAAGDSFAPDVRDLIMNVVSMNFRDELVARIEDKENPQS